MILVLLHSQFSSSSSCFWIRLLLCVCKQRASFMHMLRLFFSVFGEFQAPPIGWNMNYSVLSLFQWTQIFLKRCRGRRRKKRLFWYVWTQTQSNPSFLSDSLQVLEVQAPPHNAPDPPPPIRAIRCPSHSIPPLDPLTRSTTR